MSSSSSWLLQNSGLMAFIVSILLCALLFVAWALRWRRSSATIRSAAPPLGVCTGDHELPLTASAIASLPTFAYAATSRGRWKNDECAICLALLAEGEVVKVLPKCTHAFHVHCIDVWLRWHSTCPLCRTDAKLKAIDITTSAAAAAAAAAAAQARSDVEAAEISTGDSSGPLPPLPPV